MTPNKVTANNEEDVRLATYFSRQKKYIQKPYKYKTGDRVRITHLRNVFSREYDQRWREEFLQLQNGFDAMVCHFITSRVMTAMILQEVSSNKNSKKLN